jgi:hypothetical protein
VPDKGWITPKQIGSGAHREPTARIISSARGSCGR